MLCSLLAAATPARQAFDLNLFRFLLKTACVNVPVETFLQALTWAKTRKFSDRTGMNDYLPKLSAVQTSVCFIYGSKDRIAPERSVEAGYQMVGSRNKALVRIMAGTHMNMTCGENARKIAEITNAWCNKDEQELESQLRLNADQFIIA
jgi:poly(3-hydroxyalkanoate) synthetase